MTAIRRTILSLTLSASLTGCAGTRIEYLTDTAYPSRDSALPIEWLAGEPTGARVDIARMTGRSSNYSLETLRHTMLDRARALGADAIVPEVPTIVGSGPGGLYYEIVGLLRAPHTTTTQQERPA